MIVPKLLQKLRTFTMSCGGGKYVACTIQRVFSKGIVIVDHVHTNKNLADHLREILLIIN